MEKPVISGIAHDRSQDKITVTDVPNSPASPPASSPSSPRSAPTLT